MVRKAECHRRDLTSTSHKKAYEETSNRTFIRIYNEVSPKASNKPAKNPPAGRPTRSGSPCKKSSGKAKGASEKMSGSGDTTGKSATPKGDEVKMAGALGAVHEAASTSAPGTSNRVSDGTRSKSSKQRRRRPIPVQHHCHYIKGAYRNKGRKEEKKGVDKKRRKE